MTNQEAIEQLRERLAITDYRQQIPEYYEAIGLAVEAIEKQIPKTPIKDGIDYAGNPIFCCPICGDNWNSNEFADGMECCWTCGQCLDWEGIDD